METSEYERLVTQMEWADALVWQRVLAARRAHADEEMRRRLHHVHLVQHLYVQVWRGEPLQVTEHTAFESLEAIRGWAQPVHARTAEFVRSLTPERLREPVAFPWAEQVRASLGVFHTATTGQSILQVTSHTTYHRGQVCAHLRQLGGEPPLTDFISWIWLGQPAPDWSLPESMPRHD